MQPLPAPGTSIITLNPAALPEYAVRTTLRTLATLSLILTFTYATWAAKSRRAEIVLPLLERI